MQWKMSSSPWNKSLRLRHKRGRLCLPCVFWDSRGVLSAHFQKHGESVNSASYCEVLLKLRDAIRREYSGQLARGALLHHGNARPHTARATQERIQELRWELLEHPPYSPGLSPSDFNLFGQLNAALVANISIMTKRFKRRREVTETTAKRLLCCGFWRPGKVMKQKNQCWCGIWREGNIICRFEYDMFYVMYPFVTYLLTLPRT
jgi:hypothetical protein